MEVLAMTAEEVRWFEQRVLGGRVSLCVGWRGVVGRLAVLGVVA